MHLYVPERLMLALGDKGSCQLRFVWTVHTAGQLRQSIICEERFLNEISATDTRRPET